nr:PREDICTED: uncharacterized protein LOC103372433 [Stegastes partitus]
MVPEGSREDCAGHRQHREMVRCQGRDQAAALTGREKLQNNIRSHPQLQFSVIMDGTQDVSGKEQEAVCVRYVDHDLIVHEEFVGMYEVSVTTGENLAKVIMDVTEELECLNTSLQSRSQTLNGMLTAVTCVKDSIAEKRTPERFQSIYNRASQMCEKLNLSPIEMPRVRNPPKRLAGEAAAHVPPFSVDYFRTEFFKVLDTVSLQFTERFENEGLLMIRILEKVLLTGVTDDDILLQYPEVYRPSLQVQLAMFKSKYDFQSSSEAATILQGTLPEVRGLFEQVQVLVRLILTVPASSAEAERSFSGLRRLKTWLRSTMTQSQLNSVAVSYPQR